MNREAITSQLQFLKDVGLYSGSVDATWGEEQQNAMRGWAMRHSSGKTDGSPMDGTIDPPGYHFVNGVLYQNEETAPAPVKKARPTKRKHVEAASDEVAPLPVAKEKPVKPSKAFRVR